MNNDATQTLANRLIDAGFAVELQPGAYNLILSIDNYFEDEIWDADLTADEAGLVELPDGSTVPVADYDRITEILSNLQISGISHGFRHGVSLRTDAELGDDLHSLRDRGLIRARLNFPEGGLLIGSAALADATHDENYADVAVVCDYREDRFSLLIFGFDAEDTFYAVVTPNAGPIDVYDAPGEIVASN